MGREIRRVPPNWEHPKRENGSYQPMFDRSATKSYQDWLEDFEQFKEKELKEVAKEQGYDINDPYSAFCDWNGSPPDPDYYRPEWDESKATWWQVYETVSEGTPVSPAFETPNELIEYLVENGDFWDQKRRIEGRSRLNCDPWSREAAEKFVKSTGWAPTGVISNNGYQSGVDALANS